MKADGFKQPVFPSSLDNFRHIFKGNSPKFFCHRKPLSFPLNQETL